MTDEMRAREEAICEVAKVNSIGEVSDGFHTFNGLYKQRTILFAALVKAYKDKAWKSYRHEDGEYCFGGGWFIVGIDTPEGSYTYHYENKYWDMFDCIDLPRGKHWDGHTEADAETRLMSLQPEQRWIPCSERFPEEDDYRPCYGYEDGAVWWRNNMGLMGLGWYYPSTGKWAYYDESDRCEKCVGNVVEWMPLPRWEGET